MPVGNSDLELPNKDPLDHCPLGAFEQIRNGQHQLIPVTFEGYFTYPQARKLKYVNTYLQWCQNSANVPNAFPGSAIQTVIDNGYRPIITWEPMFLSLAPLDPAQPDLNKINSGIYDSYIDNFADVLKNYTDTVIIRLMHEFDGNWYPWCISVNGQDPARFVQAWQRIVSRVKAKGATKVKWMFCPNSDYAPYLSYNWFVQAYPGDSYVDYVSTDIYNAHYPAALPWWRSFKWQATESYYYLHKYFPTKPLIICELGCRERVSGDDMTSQGKASWYERMDKELQSNFRKTRGLIFFNTSTGAVADWRVNSSPASLSSVQANIWNDDYYFVVPAPLPVSIAENKRGMELKVFPNPGDGLFYLSGIEGKIKVMNLLGDIVYVKNMSSDQQELDLRSLSAGVYLLVTEEGQQTKLIIGEATPH
jgi:beta-mannanase